MGTTAIKCVDCGETRQAPNASKHLIKRCKSCQDEFNRERALQRYYERTGRKKKAKAEKAAEVETQEDKLEEESVKKAWDIGPRKEKASKTKKTGQKAFANDEESQAFLKKIHEKIHGSGSWAKIAEVAVEDDW